MRKLEEVLASLQRYGQARLGIYSSKAKWHCKVEMFVSGPGLSFDIKSDFDHETPTEAALLCEVRMLDALNQLQQQFGPQSMGALAQGSDTPNPMRLSFG